MLSRRNLLVATVFAASGSTARASELKRSTARRPAPPIELPTTTGEPFSLQQLSGKVVLVNFWATWCEPCVTEMPSLQRLRDSLAGDGFEVLAVNYQEGPARIDAFMRKAELSLLVVRDTDGRVAKSWNARVFPASFLLDRDGRIRYAVNGAADWTAPPMVRTIRALLAPQPAR